MSSFPVIRARQMERERNSKLAREQMRRSLSDEPWNIELPELIRVLRTHLESGLSEDEARSRRELEGLNELRAAERTPGLVRFLGQFKSPVVMTLLVATGVSGALGELVDAIAILTIVVVNSLIGYLQESKAEAAVEALKKLASPRARVLRDSQVKEVPAEEITVGDILILEAGDYIGADARLITANQVSTDEAVLTGESLPVKKQLGSVSVDAALGDRSNMLFAGTAVFTGSARAVVTAIGMDTEIGQIAEMLEDTGKTETPLQRRLEEVSSKLLLVCLGVVVIVAVLGLIHGDKWLTVLMTAISLAVAAIPEGLPAVVTLALALAIRRMVHRNAIIRHLPAVETLGSTDVICTDKTGTLTTGKMRVREIVSSDGTIQAVDGISVDDHSKYQELVRAAVLCSNASLSPNGEATGDPTEVALLILAKDLAQNQVGAGVIRIAEWSFDSVRKRMSVAVREHNSEIRVYCKGAPESVIPLCRLDNGVAECLLSRVQELSSKGRRILAVAKRSATDESVATKDNSEAEQNLEFLGLVAIADPPRSEAIAAIKSCKAAGIRVVMITGDHPVTAKAIAVELGIVEPGKFDGVLTGPELEFLSIEELKKRVAATAVYARVAPEHKLRIVEAWKAHGQTVAMTGDGVNDAPALKAASIGISMGKGGTEVARQASSMILADDNFATIVSAVEEGRAIYGNIRRTVQYLLSGNVAEILVMLGAAVAGLPVPLDPIHLLWINLVTDGLPSLALAAEPVPENLLETSSRPSPKRFFDRKFYQEMSFIGATIAAMALAIYIYSLKNEDEVTARTHVFSFLVFAELFRSFACRSETKTFFQMGPLSNVFHLVAVAIPISFQLLLHHTDWFNRLFDVRMVTGKECVVLLALTLVPVTVLEGRKYLKQRQIGFLKRNEM